ncbi:acyl-CoA synthetase [Prosthecobacter sp.]|uniref:acyl-CoA synthetase n=1 Tax=Prosthecobacter sp. TaxID=1965333 RepID=UPI001D258B81|nr:acyl-CoA synthetase [Prosthecobacter sp.]MCB1278678.1 acyl-CoA synthetase [Prosthecobacter sp.]
MPDLPFIARARSFADRIAFRTPEVSHTYQQLLDRSSQIAVELLQDQSELQEARVALLVAPGFEYTASQWAIWRAGGMKLPICLSATESEWEYALTDSQVGVVIADASNAPKIASLCQKIGVRLVNVSGINGNAVKALPDIDVNRRAMILYTSGTTSKPKGVVTTHANIQAQIESLVQAWEWSAEDRIPMFLPLHHIHGIINITGCALWSGAVVEPFARFEMNAILERVRDDAYTLFMAVPTIYVKLIQALEAACESDRAAIVAGFKKMRLMVSGSAALPASVHQQWTALTGQELLERYGMTEIGMAISNLYRGERRPGSVGAPLPGVEVRLKAENGPVITAEDEPGEIQVRGATVFQAYWNRPEATAETFEDGWFRTGDMAVLERGYYRIMGRLSVDIIKSGGYKLSALEIEAALLEHPLIAECAVIGLPDDTWGEAVTAAVVLKSSTLELAALREWCKGRLSVYKIPQRLKVVTELPRNAMGKVTKPAVKALF